MTPSNKSIEFGKLNRNGCKSQTLKIRQNIFTYMQAKTNDR